MWLNRKDCRFGPNSSQELTLSGSRRIQGFPFLGMAKVRSLSLTIHRHNTHGYHQDTIVASVHTPSFEVLHSLILLSWAEYGGGRENGLNVYSAVSTTYPIGTRS